MSRYFGWDSLGLDGQRRLIDRRETASILGICERTLYSMTARGEIPSVPVGRNVRYDTADLLKWIEDRKRQPVASEVQ